MTINRFNRPVTPRVISQFVPEDMQTIANVMAAKQQRYDIERNKLELTQDAISKLPSIGAVDSTYVAQKGKELDAIAKQYASKDLSDPRIAKQLRDQARTITNDETLKGIQQSVAAAQQWQKDKQELSTKGLYTKENDPFAKQYEQYLKTGITNGPLNYTGIIAKVDERKAAEEYVNNLPEVGAYQFVQASDKLAKVGYQGHTADQLRKVVDTSVDSFAGTSAGQQALRRFNELEGEGRVPDGMTGRDYLTSILTSAAQERIGKISTGLSQGIQNSNYGGGSAFPTSSGSSIATQFTTPEAASLKGIKFSEDGKIKGHGSLPLYDAIKTLGVGPGIGAWWNNVDLDPATRTKFKEVIALADAKGITEKQAAATLDQRVSPTYQQLSGKPQNDLTKSFYTKAAGFADNMTAIDENGKEHLAKDVFENAELQDSKGNFDPEVAKQKGILVDGLVQGDSGYTPGGLLVSVGADNYIFVDRNPDPQQTLNYLKARLAKFGVATVPDYVQPFVIKDKNNNNIQYNPGQTFVLDKQDNPILFKE